MGDLVNMSDQFGGLDMANLIGGPLKAACDAQSMMASATAKFIEDVGTVVADKEKGTRKLRTTAFSFARSTTDEKTGEIRTVNVSMDVPLLAIVKVPTLAIDNVDVTFDMEVKSSTSSEKKEDKEASAEVNGGYKFGGFHVDATIKGSVSCHESNTRSSDNSAKYHVQVHAKDYGMPEGLSRMLDILATACTPTAIEDAGNNGKSGEGKG